MEYTLTRIDPNAQRYPMQKRETVADPLTDGQVHRNVFLGKLEEVMHGVVNWGRAKNEPFESGVVGAGSTRMRLSAKFYLVAMFFVIFDVEALFLYAWAISLKESGWAGFIEAFIFIFILAASLVYLWLIGALEWAPESRKKWKAEHQSPPAVQ